MLKKQVLAVLIVVVAISGIGFAAKMQSTAADEQRTVMSMPQDTVQPDYRQTLPDIAVFKGVAVDNDKIFPAALISIDMDERRNSQNAYEYRYNFLVIDQKITSLELTDSIYDSRTKTTLLTFTDSSNRYRFILRWMYGNAFLSGNFGEYEINMNLVARQYSYPQPTNTDDAAETVKNPLPYVSQEMTQEDAYRIAGSIASKIN